MTRKLPPDGSPGPRPRRSGTRVVRGLVAAVVLGVLLVGVPWALARYVGWPLPDQVPSWDDLQGVLTTPLGDAVVLNILAVLCWTAWIIFVIDVVRAIPGAVHAAARGLPRPVGTTRGPVYGLAAGLVTAVAVAVLVPRAPADTPGPVFIVSASAVTPTPDGNEVLPAGHLAASEPGHDPEHARQRREVVVREPRDGIHDCLWRIADRELGDGARWPEIYQLNHGRPQPDGRALTNPDLIYPGWVLQLPEPSEASTNPPTDAPTDPPPDQPTAPPAPPDPTLTPSPAVPTPSPSASAADTAAPTPTAIPPAATPPMAPDGRAAPGVDLGPGVFIGTGVAAILAAAAIVLHRRRRRWYRPGSGYRADLPTAPIISSLRIAHLDHPSGTGTAAADEVTGIGGELSGTTTDPTSSATSVGGLSLPIGVTGDQQILLDLAHQHGLGLVGPGADAVARALLLTVLTAGRDAATLRDTIGHPLVLIPADDARQLLDGPGLSDRPPAGLTIAGSLNDTLNRLEEPILGVVVHGDTTAHAPGTVLVATPQPGAEHRLQAVLDNGAPFGVSGVLLGQWRAGSTLHLRADGTVTATNPGPARRLLGARLFTLPAAQAADMLDLLHLADHDTGRPGSDPPPTRQTACDPTEDAQPRSEQASAGEAAPTSEPDSDGPASPPLGWSILGSPSLTWRHDAMPRDLTDELTSRHRELLVYLALHPDGVTRDTIIDALWPDSTDDRPANALHTTLSRIRRALHAATGDDQLAQLVTSHRDRYQLNPELVDVDYWRHQQAVSESRTAPRDADRAATDQRIVAAYRGHLGAGLAADWVDVPREATRRDALDAAARLAHTYLDDDPHMALNYLERARDIDPYNELVYRDIMRTQARLGHHDAVARTLSLLTTRLAELDERPDPGTVHLAHELRRHGQARHDQEDTAHR